MARMHKLFAAILTLAACSLLDDEVTPRDLYERHVLADDADAIGLFSGVPSDDEGPWQVRHLDNPQPPVNPDVVVVRIEFAKSMSPAKAALLRDALKALGAAEFEGETDGQHGTTTATSSGG